MEIGSLVVADAQTAFVALQSLKGLGIERVENVDDAFATVQQKAGDVLKEEDRMLVDDLRQFLSQTDGPCAKRRLCDWMVAKEWFWSVVEQHPEFKKTRYAASSESSNDDASNSSDSTPSLEEEAGVSCDEEDEKEPNFNDITTRLLQAAEIITASLQSDATSVTNGSANVSLKLELADACSSPFSHVIDCARVNQPAFPIRFTDYPINAQTDSYRGITRFRRILMQVALCTTDGQREAEFLVNLVGEGPSHDRITTYSIITAQGQMTNLVTSASVHSSISNQANALRATEFEEAMYLFKMALVSVAEHTSLHVIHAEPFGEPVARTAFDAELCCSEGSVTDDEADVADLHDCEADETEFVFETVIIATNTIGAAAAAQAPPFLKAAGTARPSTGVYTEAEAPLSTRTPRAPDAFPPVPSTGKAPTAGAAEECCVQITVEGGGCGSRNPSLGSRPRGSVTSDAGSTFLRARSRSQCSSDEEDREENASFHSAASQDADCESYFSGETGGDSTYRIEHTFTVLTPPTSRCPSLPVSDLGLDW
ncbi:hypothetical protein DIPPA_14346 [Diplonema papillatum]|nr:hypothetical protein DIPPA_14346 [Diplonema papillatum]